MGSIWFEFLLWHQGKRYFPTPCVSWTANEFLLLQYKNRYKEDEWNEWMVSFLSKLLLLCVIIAMYLTLKIHLMSISFSTKKKTCKICHADCSLKDIDPFGLSSKNSWSPFTLTNFWPTMTHDQCTDTNDCL